MANYIISVVSKLISTIRTFLVATLIYSFVCIIISRFFNATEIKPLKVNFSTRLPQHTSLLVSDRDYTCE